MKNKILLLVLLIISLIVNAQTKIKTKADKDTKAWKYEIECISTNTSGTYLVKVWSYSKSKQIAIEQAKKNAIHGVIFRGLSGEAGCSQKPLANSVSLEIEKEEFFKAFFADGGRYMKFVTFTGDGNVSEDEIIKVGKEYKIGVVVSVQKDEIRRDLEEAGVLEGLNSGF